MKFSNMPYERVDLESFSNDWNNLVKHFEAAKSGS